MENLSKFLLIALVISAIALVSAATRFIGYKEFAAVVKNVSPDKSQENYKARIKQGLGEIKFSSSSSENKIAASVKSLSKFMEDRSGVALSPAPQQVLVAQEQDFCLNKNNGISSSELGNLIYETVLERASNWNEAEIASAVESWKGMDHPDLPQSYKKGRSRIKLRANGAGIRIEQLLDFLSALKKGRQEVPEYYLSYFKQEVTHRTKNQVEYFSDVMPEQFSPSEQNISPFNSMLIAYSVISDDDFTDSIEKLNKNMNDIFEWHIKNEGKYPNPNRFKAYGPNGYKYSSPTNLLLDSNGINILLKGLQNRKNS